MIVDAHVGWDTNGYFCPWPCGIGNLAENNQTPRQPAGRLVVSASCIQQLPGTLADEGFESNLVVLVRQDEPAQDVDHECGAR